ncbi:MerR family transcriptional regulator [Paenibacillus alginolyticus]|uniref:MerR family transcriptional regulator n=1 Tax=Paenibacillus alginolyticus TaxID=59839 RepID=A0ABT4GLJ2_9BACL|nr:MerR family transcriptional regulator [Paenibacillus alginolyticus]MCY9697073.1 MerR family transcriptional regulator [Paenibacillus alginolyticus]MEC0146436.1 MerR family transcriptional regulator [Paenibacillus alginolyticus]
MMYTIRQASTLLGIPAVTIRAWETRYGAIKPVRTEGGYRLFTDKNMEDLRFLKIQTDEKGMTISQAVRMLKEQQDLREQLVESKPEMDAYPGKQAHQDMIDRLYDSLSNFRTEQAKTMIELGFSMYGYDMMIYHILFSVMIKVGTEWEEGRASVAQEHFITQFVTQRCLSFFHLFPVDERLPRMLALCPTGEHHQAGLLLFSLFLRKKGADVLYLGPDTPEDGIQKILQEQHIRVICLSLTDPKLMEQTFAFIDRLRTSNLELEVVLGGQGFQDVPEPYAAWVLPSDSQVEWENWFQDRVLRF